MFSRDFPITAQQISKMLTTLVKEGFNRLIIFWTLIGVVFRTPHQLAGFRRNAYKAFLLTGKGFDMLVHSTRNQPLEYLENLLA